MTHEGARIDRAWAAGLFSQVANRPGQYGITRDFRGLVGFILGFDAATRWGLLPNFEEWIRSTYRLSSVDNYAWYGLIGFVVRQEGGDETSDAERVAMTVRLIAEFLQVPGSPHHDAEADSSSGTHLS